MKYNKKTSDIHFVNEKLNSQHCEKKAKTKTTESVSQFRSSTGFSLISGEISWRVDPKKISEKQAIYRRFNGFMLKNTEKFNSRLHQQGSEISCFCCLAKITTNLQWFYFCRNSEFYSGIPRCGASTEDISFIVSCARVPTTKWEKFSIFDSLSGFSCFPLTNSTAKSTRL